MSDNENNGLRITVVLVMFFGSLAMVFSPLIQKVLHPGEKVADYVNLKRGIDMVGGTSLVYEIKKPDATQLNGTLASRVAEVLKKRVDPTGVKNLIWRPEGDSRLEIQMPLSQDADKSAEKRQELREQMIAAEDALKATNVAPEAVIDAIESASPGSRATLMRMAGDSKDRQKLFTELKDLWDRIQKARASGDAKAWSRLQLEFDQKIPPKNDAGVRPRTVIENTNVSLEKLGEVLASTEPHDQSKEAIASSTADRAKELAEFKQKFGDFPSRVKAIDDYVKASTTLAASQGGLDDATDLKRLLKGAGVLEYHILCAGTMANADYSKYLASLESDGPHVRAGDEAKWFEVDKDQKVGRTETYGKKQYVLGYIVPGPDGKPRSLDSHAERPWHLTDADAEREQNGEKAVGFAFDPQGADYFGELTAANIGKPMAIVLDNKVISAPVINSKISSRGIITGGQNGFTDSEQEYLVSTLKGGSLPAALSDEPISERTVGPQLGKDNLEKGLIACFLGLVVVAVFMCGYYFTAGIVATCAVIMNVLLVLAVMSFLGATFTLPSVAGIVLSVGTAVDANVLIFERLREEQHRGLSLRLALRNAYGKAFSAILDSNMTTAITSVFLIIFGSEEVKGFGVTLIIGIVASLFTALFVTRTVFSVMMEKFGLKHLRSIPLIYPRWDKALRPNIDWMGKAWAFISFSIIGITVGLVLFFLQVRKGEMMGIEFASGTSVQFEMKEPIKQKDLRDLMEKEIQKQKYDSVLPAFAVVTVGNDDKTYEVVTPNSKAVEVRDALLKVMVDKSGNTLLKVLVPSTFEGNAAKLTDQISKNIVIPLEDKKTLAADKWPDGYRPEDDTLKDFEPGVAIVLSNLEPPLSAEQIKDRMKQQQLQLPAGTPEKALDFTVVTRGLKGAPSKLAVVLCRNSDLPYSKDPAKWQASLAEPLWQLVNESVNRQAQLQQVKNFDAQVARDATRDAMLTLVLSIAVIMAYIWFRFGNLKYGTATMVALIHDVLFTIAALGFAHYLVEVPILKNIFQLEAFRIDLTVVAGILTIMGYSMIDTIVVFDRIRENRGKFGLVNRKVINDAINQTLSRTLLTAGTNVVTVAIMYFLGGPGIHGFTFVLLIGILVGTYSSVAIAAPILLLGRQEEEVGRVVGALRPART